MTPERSAALNVPDRDLIGAIQTWSAQESLQQKVVGLRRSAWNYATSATLELVTAAADDGSERTFVLKHLGAQLISANARRAKPDFVGEPRRELEVYRRLLAPARVGPRLIGCGPSAHAGDYWLLLEFVAGQRLFEIGERQTWVAVASWLATMHEHLAVLDSQSLRQEARLIAYDRDWYLIWLRRALQFLSSGESNTSRRRVAALRWLADRYDNVVDHLLALPPTIIHGEFYPSNVLVTPGRGSAAVVPLDWEMTSMAPAVVDLAALTSGRWPETDRRAMIAAYVTGSREAAPASVEDVVESVNYAGIHLAIQWLGWFGRRQPPADHAHDWLADAIRRAEALGL